MYQKIIGSGCLEHNVDNNSRSCPYIIVKNAMTDYLVMSFIDIKDKKVVALLEHVYMSSLNWILKI